MTTRNRGGLPLLGGLDPGITGIVNELRARGVPTSESCEGGPGHSFPEPTVRFKGTREDGFQALGIALQLGMPVRALRRVWRVIDGEPCGPLWELSFYPERPDPL
jgi:hypothetical protein